MSKYRIKIDGKTYEMEIELIAGDAASKPVAKGTKQEAKGVQNAVKTSAAAPVEKKEVTASNGVVAAPMPGTVIRIEKEEGATVQAGEVVLILEAMKMENEITAPVSGTVTRMNCKAGCTVAGGDVLFEVK